jgi:tetratricopeptide (TPR) repeat protein
VWLGGVLALCCAEYSHTTRIVDGRQVDGRPIPAEAYAAYLEGAAFEARGESERAVASYLVALDADPESATLHTALARALCRLDRQEAEQEFEVAVDLDPHYEPAHRERARCALHSKDPRAALRHAERAVVAAPFEYTSTEVLVDALVSLGRRAEARRVLWGYLAIAPDAPGARTRMLELSPELEGLTDTPELSLRAALRDGDDDHAVEIALQQRLGRVELARRALMEARPDLALEQSRMVLLADPSNSDARAVALLAAFVLEDTRAYRASLRDGWHEHRLPSEASGPVLAELIAARAGAAAANAFLDALARARAEEPKPAPQRPLPHELWERRRRDAE